MAYFYNRLQMIFNILTYVSCVTVGWTCNRVTWVSWFVSFRSDLEARCIRISSVSASIAVIRFPFLKQSTAWFTNLLLPNGFLFQICLAGLIFQFNFSAWSYNNMSRPNIMNGSYTISEGIFHASFYYYY